MANFLTNLFESIFTPGPTPTLLVATNVAFAALQVTLLLLLIATYSIHFLILSGLSAGLWWSINWFVAELRASEREEAERKRLQDEGAESEVETVIGEEGGVGSKEVEVLDKSVVGEVKDRRAGGGGGGAGAGGKGIQASKSEASTEDEWERVSENENEKDK